MLVVVLFCILIYDTNKISEAQMRKSKLSNCKAVILAGGAGTRLYPITKELPKPLLPVNKKPIINHLIDLFHSYGIRQIAILINKDFREDFKWWQKRYYGSASSPRIPRIKIFGEEKPLGTFGGLWLLKKWISNNKFFLTNGDELKKINLFKMKDFHCKMKTPATIALIKTPNFPDYGVVICEKGIVQKFLEKPSLSQISRKSVVGKKSANYINSGLYLLSSEIFNYHPGPKFLMIEKDLFPKLAKEKKLAGFKFRGCWMDCGTWERYSRALKDWK
jgi:NDP-sugar pyrophosphorylase family protein